MSILESLHLRMAGDDPQDLMDLVLRAADAPGRSPLVSIYRHSRLQGDLLIHLCWEGPDRVDRPSELGLRLASLLRLHGLVEHSVWVRGGESQGSA